MIIKHNLTEENYYQDKEFLNCSTLKLYGKGCTSKALAVSQGKFVQDFSNSDAILVGKYVDAAIEGTLDEFLENNPQCYAYGNASKGLKKDFKEANIMIDKIKKDPYATRLLTGDKQTILVGEIEGVKVKIKIDNINHENGFFTDLKTARDIYEVMYSSENKRRETFIEFRGYLLQGAMYREVIRQNYEKIYNFAIVAYDKTDDLRGMCITFQPDELDEALEEVRMLLRKHKETLEGETHRCEKCDYCNSTRSHSLVFNSYSQYKEFSGVY